MTANHAHTPTIDHIREQFIEAWAGDFVFGKVDAAKYFDRTLDAHNASIEAAAEQRGAERGKAEGYDTALNEATSRGLISIDAHDLLNLNNPYRADRIANKENE